MSAVLEVLGATKTFTMHLQGGLSLPVVRNVNFSVQPGHCVVLAGPSGAGKSSVLKMIFGNYRCDNGQILIHDKDAMTDIATAEPRRILALRNNVMGYVSQFLRAVPRVAAIDVVAEKLISRGTSADRARMAAGDLLEKLNIPAHLWSVPPATFSGGEQQRVNIARGFLPDMPILLLDEPTASLDSVNRDIVIELIAEKKRQGVAMVAIVHDEDVRDAIADVVVDISKFSAAA
jgi:alpha-D-ribose 1-methylphosphonate 5-triphosphate synthase subunit PhnL